MKKIFDSTDLHELASEARSALRPRRSERGLAPPIAETEAREGERAPRTTLQNMAVLGNHLPRRCGIATFTSDLTDALRTERPDLGCFVLAMNEEGSEHRYPARVRRAIAAGDLSAYRAAADFLNASGIEVLSLQHEYGIFGGSAGSHVVALLRGLKMPVVTTLHTILANPSPAQRLVMQEITSLSARLVVMSARSKALLQEVYAVAADKIDFIPHGIPEIPFVSSEGHPLGIDAQSNLLTFGLLSPDKGIEYVIDALPAILERHPEATYVVLGATHPQIRAQHGEVYREMLTARARKLGVSDQFILHDHFVSNEELAKFLSAALIYVTPYLNAEQSTSGTLAYAVGSGRAVISTPYAHARELLDEGRGVLVPWRDPVAIAREVNALLDDRERCLALRQRAAAYGRDMLWPSVGRAYLRSFERARADHARAARVASTSAPVSVRLPPVNLAHLSTLSDPTGILQHASFNIPRYADGYCLDDNARALLLTTSLEAHGGYEDVNAIRAFGARYLAFIGHAFDTRALRFRNFMSYARQWIEVEGSEDSHGRALWALGSVVSHSRDAGRRSFAGELFLAALPALEGFTSPRAWAYALLGISEYVRTAGADVRVRATGMHVAERLLDLYLRTSRPDWPWFEDRVTYCNARLSQALLASASWMEEESMKSVGLRSLEWLSSIQSTDGYFTPIGSNGFYSIGGPRAFFDQQPVEAHAMTSACLFAYRATGDGRWRDEASRAFNWFLGQNQLHQPVYDASTGGCRDGLHADRRNENQGAESTLSFLLALVEMRAAAKSSNEVSS